jgi:hypothetical protein
MNEYLNLRNAIIKQAIDDYRKAGRYIRKWKGRCNTRQRELAFQRAELMKEEVERFFRGKWAQDLCGNVDPMMILRRLHGDERAAKGDKVSGSAH